MIKIAPYYKAVTAGLGELVTATTAIVSLLTLVSDQYHGVAVGASVLIGVLGIAKPAYVYLVANEPLVDDIDTAVTQAAPVVQQVEHAAGALAHELPAGGPQ
ncbi:hypothetical protein [Nocardia niigatensis]|uniref:hypothetical protein n=1 Tax=Nocardia niigatensis TaxID=209249 RepID=UPI0002DFC2EC|nr:hypothetical protein [Nocardia niigatensis]